MARWLVGYEVQRFAGAAEVLIFVCLNDPSQIASRQYGKSGFQ